MSVQRWHGVHQGLIPDDKGPLVKFDDLYEIYNVTVGKSGEEERYKVTGESHPSYYCFAAKDEHDARKMAEGYGFVIAIKKLTPRSTQKGILMSHPWKRGA